MIFNKQNVVSDHCIACQLESRIKLKMVKLRITHGLI